MGDLGKLLLPNALKSCPKSNKSPDLVTVIVINNFDYFFVKIQGVHKGLSLYISFDQFRYSKIAKSSIDRFFEIGHQTGCGISSYQLKSFHTF